MAKRLRLEDILGDRQKDDYTLQCAYVNALVKEGRLTPLKASGMNGKKPPLHLEYWLKEEKKDYTNLREELTYKLHPLLSTSFYLRNLPTYEKEREMVLLLSRFLTYHRESLDFPLSVNERSYEIFGREKYLGTEGKTLLKHCGLDLSFFHVYETVEPFAYFAAERTVPQRILILENKDPFFGMRKHLLEGGGSILGERISTLIFGGGKRVDSTFKAFSQSAEPYMLDERNTFLYLGDLDYVGIEIYETLREVIPFPVIPFLAGYEAMLQKASLQEMPLQETKKGQRPQEGSIFFSYFPEQTAKEMKRLLAERAYIPQEILNGRDYEKSGKGGKGNACTMNS